MGVSVKTAMEQGDAFMKLYATGMIGCVATVTSLVANIQWMEHFNSSHPYIYWGGQVLLCLLSLFMEIHTLRHWDRKAPASKKRFVSSILLYACMYVIAYTGSIFSLVLIFVVGLVDTFLTRNQFGMAKEKTLPKLHH